MKPLLLLLTLLLIQESELDSILRRFDERQKAAPTDAAYFRIVEATRAEIEAYLKKSPPDAGRATFELARMHLFRNDLEKAVAHFDEFVSKYPEDPQVAKGRLAAAELQLQLEKDEDAARRLAEFIRLHPSDDGLFHARFLSALIPLYSGKLDDAAAAFEKIRTGLKDRKEVWIAAMQQVLCYHLAEKPADARRLLEEVVAKCPEAPIVAMARRLMTEYAFLRQEVPDFKALDTKGEEFSLSRHKGKVVILWFFKARQSMSDTEHAFLMKTAEAFEGKDLVILGVSLDASPKEFEFFAEERKIPWPLHFDGKGFEGKLAKHCSVRELPWWTVLDRAGRSRFFNVGGRELRLAVQKLLDEK